MASDYQYFPVVTPFGSPSFPKTAKMNPQNTAKWTQQSDLCCFYVSSLHRSYKLKFCTFILEKPSNLHLQQSQEADYSYHRRYPDFIVFPNFSPITLQFPDFLRLSLQEVTLYLVLLVC